VISSTRAAFAVIGVAIIGWFSSLKIPPAPPVTKLKIDYNIFRASYRLIGATMHIRAAVSGDRRDQRVLDDRGGTRRAVPAAGQERVPCAEGRRLASSWASSRSASRSDR
jgi:hypothetical protein